MGISIDILKSFKRAEYSLNNLTENNNSSNNINVIKEIISSKKNSNTIKNNNDIFSKKESSNKNGKKANNKELTATKSRNMKYMSPKKDTENKEQITSINNENEFCKKKNYNTNYTNRRIKNTSPLYRIIKHLYTPQKCKKKHIEDYSFSPEINSKSRGIYKKSIKYKRSNTPIGDILYNEANIKKQKLKMKLLLKEKNEIINSKANKIKTSIISNNMVILRKKKLIDNTIRNIQKKGNCLLLV